MENPGARIDRQLDGLLFRATQGHPAMQAVRALPQRSYCGRSTQHGSISQAYAWLIKLVPQNVPGLRDLFQTGTVTFSQETIDALQELSGHKGFTRT